MHGQQNRKFMILHYKVSKGRKRTKPQMEKGEKWTKEEDEVIGCMLLWETGVQPSCYILAYLDASRYDEQTFC